LQSQGGAVQWPDPAMGRVAPLRRLRGSGRGLGRSRPDPARGVSGDPRPHPPGGVPPTEGAAPRVSAVPAGRGWGAPPPRRPLRRLLGPGVLEAAGRLQWTDLDLWARPIGRSGLGSPGSGAAVRGVLTVLDGLRSSWGTDQADPGDRTDPRADHGLSGQPPQV